MADSRRHADGDVIRDLIRLRTGALSGRAYVKTYEGKRTIDGLVVTIDGRKLDEHYDIKRFTRFGFEWSYEGDSPQQLALAILVDYLSDPAKAMRLSKPFMQKVIANLDNDWTLSGTDIDVALRQMEGS